MSVKQNKSDMFSVGMRVIVTKPTQADIKEGIKGDMIGHVDQVTSSFIHVAFESSNGRRYVYPFFPHQIRPF